MDNSENTNCASSISIPDGVIPNQMRNDNFRFIKLANPSKNPRMPRSGKEPLERGWNIDHNYAYNDEKFVEFLNKHNNYGVIPQGDVCVFDVDDYDSLDNLDKNGTIKFHALFDDTFIVKSGHESGKHMHIYFRVADAAGRGGHKVVLNDRDNGNKHYGEIYFGGCNAYVVGPYSKHDSGNYYVPNDCEIKEIDRFKIEDFLNTFFPESFTTQYQKKIPSASIDAYTPDKNSLTEKLGLRIEDLAMPADAIDLGDGEFQGSHPIHGSTTGHNFNINVNKNVWKCWRCDSGGDPAIWLAVEYGIIECREAHPGVLDDNELFGELLEEMRNDQRFSEKMKIFDQKYHLDKSYNLMMKLSKSKYDNKQLENDDEETENVNSENVTENNEISEEPKVSLEYTKSTETDTVPSKVSSDDNSGEKTYANIPENNILTRRGSANEEDEISDKVYNGLKLDADVRSGKRKLYSSDGKLIKITHEYNADTERMIRAALMYGEEVTSQILDTDSDEVAKMKRRNIYKMPRISNLEYTCNLESSNYIMKYVDFASSSTDAYLEYHYAGAISLLSMIVQHKAYIMSVGSRVYPCTWLFALGPSSISRKSTAIKISTSIAREVNPYQAMPDDFTPESLIETLSSDVGDNGSIISNSIRWMFRDEVGAVLDSMNKKTYMSGIIDLFCKLYDGTDHSRKLRSKKDSKSEFVVHNPYITLLWTTTHDTFTNNTNSVMVSSGMLYRFLYFSPEHINRRAKGMTLDFGKKDTNEKRIKRENLVNGLKSRFFIFDKLDKELEFYLDEEGSDFFLQWSLLRERQSYEFGNEISRTMLSRNMVYALKLAILFQIGSEEFVRQYGKCGNFDKICKSFDGTVKIKNKYIYEACRQIDEYFFVMGVYAANDAITDVTTDEMARMISIIRKEPGGRITRTKLSRSMHITSKNLDELIETMTYNKEIEVDYDRSTKHPTSWICLKEIDETDTSDYMPIDDDESPYVSKSKSKSKKSDTSDSGKRGKSNGKSAVKSSNDVPSENGEVDFGDF